MGVKIPPCVENGKLLIRGTAEWDDREDARRRAGCCCLSFGTLFDSRATNGKSAVYRGGTLDTVSDEMRKATWRH